MEDDNISFKAIIIGLVVLLLYIAIATPGIKPVKKTIIIPTITVTMPTPHPTITIKPLPTQNKENNTMELPKGSDGSFKAYMDYRTISDRTSHQYMLQGLAITDSDGFRRFSGCYLVAMGSFYAKRIGERFFVYFEDKAIEVMIGDFKQDKHTIDGQYCKQNKSIVEFIVDDRIMSHDKLQQYFKGRILRIRKEN